MTFLIVCHCGGVARYASTPQVFDLCLFAIPRYPNIVAWDKVRLKKHSRRSLAGRSRFLRSQAEALETAKVAPPNGRAPVATFLSAWLMFAPISGDFVRELRVPRKDRRRKSKIALSEKLRGRAESCRRLALGADDPNLTHTLGVLAYEYETVAAEAERLDGDRKFKIVEAVKFGYDLRLSSYKRKRRLIPRTNS
jgi:hypothetical protein